VPARLGPAGLGIYGGVRYDAGFLIFLMPYSAFGLQSGAVKSYRPTPTLPGLEHFNQVASQATDLRSGSESGRVLRGLWKVRLEGKRPSSQRSWRTFLISEVGSSRTAKSSPTLCSLLTIMITSAFIKSFSE